MAFDYNKPYIRLRAEDGPTIFLQAGRVVAENGDVFREDQLPEWFQREFDKIKPQALAEVGFDVDIPAEEIQPAEPSDPAQNRGTFDPTDQRRRLEEAAMENSEGPKEENPLGPEDDGGVRPFQTGTTSTETASDTEVSTSTRRSRRRSADEE